MTIHKVLRIGDSMLHQTSQPVKDPQASEIACLIDDMFETMYHHQGAGLAAPQIGVLLRVVIFGFEQNPRYPQAEPVPETVLINPKIELLTSDICYDWEGCLSIPGMRGRVPRCNQIRYQGIGRQGESITRVAEGFHARVVMHECDHLDGVLYPQRIVDMSDFGFTEELQHSGRYQPAPCDSKTDAK